MNIKLRIIYALHMLLPLSLAAWHVERLSPDTVRGLLDLFS
jgi:hypothetical protein